MLKCPGCHTGAIAKVEWYPSFEEDMEGSLQWVYPAPVDANPLPEATPRTVAAEFEEAELCASVGAYRAATTMLRSTLEKVLRHAGYDAGTLDARINLAAQDGVIAEARKVLAHRSIRVLGNDVLHDDWREVEEVEYERSHLYTQRIIEDFYSDRDSVVRVLQSKARTPRDDADDEVPF